MSALTTRLTAAQAAVQVLAAQLAAQAAELAYLSVLATTYTEPVDAQPPASPPVRPPPATAPAPAVAQILPTRVAIDPTQQILFEAYQAGAQFYDRNDDLLLLRGASATIRFRGANHANSGSDRVLLASHYRLLVDGVEAASVDLPAGAMRGIFNLPLADLADGWHWLTIDGGTTETCVPWYGFVQHGATPPEQTLMPVMMGSHELANQAKGTAVFYAMVPSRFAPTVLPLTPRETPAFSDSTTDRRTLVQVDLVPTRPGDNYRPRLQGGVLHTANPESYYYATLEGNEYAALATLDGPRGKGCVAMATHLQIGRTAVYFCDGYRVGKISGDGTVTTLVGYRHPAPAPRVPAPLTPAALQASLELVGDWSAVSVKGFRGSWGFTWDLASVATDETAAPIPNNGTLEKPHVPGGPRLLIADAHHGRVAVATFDPASHETPAKVTELITGLNDPWDVVCVDNVLYVSERQANRIAAYDAKTGAFLRVVVSGLSGLALVDQNRFVRRVATLATIRAQQCVLPEGLYHQDGWLYYGSIAMGQVRRVNLTTGVIEIPVADITYSFSFTNFVKLAVSDGSFGPRGTVFLVTWTNAAQGRPKAWLPDGTEWAWAGVGAGLSGPGRAWESLGYGSAVAVGQGRLVCGTSSEGIVQHSKALPSDVPTKNTDWARIRTAYESAGLLVTHGPGGFGYYGLPLPWGISADIDAYLQAYGHTRPA